MDDALGGVLVLRCIRDLQRCVLVMVSVLLRNQNVHRVLAVESHDKRFVDPLQEVHPPEAVAPRAGNRRVHQPGEGERLQSCDRCRHKDFRLRIEVHRGDGHKSE